MSKSLSSRYKACPCLLTAGVEGSDGVGSYGNGFLRPHGHSFLVDQHLLHVYPEMKLESSSLLSNCPQQL